MKKNSRFSSKGLFADIKNDVVAMFGEFVGTILFLLAGLGAVQTIAANLAIDSTGGGGESTGTSPTGSDSARLIAFYYISAAFGISLFATASIFYRVTGSIFNPSVTLALFLIGAVKPVRFVLVCFAQMLGAIVASAIIDGVTPGKLAVACTLGNGTSRTQGLFLEMFGTAALVLAVLFTAAEKSAFTPFAPIGFGFMLFAVELYTVPFTGGAINTARAFGPAVISGFTNYHWIYWLGPTLGALIATAFYAFLKWVHYWNINPGQDSTNDDDAPLQEIAC